MKKEKRVRSHFHLGISNVIFLKKKKKRMTFVGLSRVSELSGSGEYGQKCTKTKNLDMYLSNRESFSSQLMKEY